MEPLALRLALHGALVVTFTWSSTAAMILAPATSARGVTWAGSGM